jgi:hypothetical protein
MLFLLRKSRQITLFIAIVLPILLILKYNYTHSTNGGAILLDDIYKPSNSVFLNAIVFLFPYYILLFLLNRLNNAYGFISNRIYFSILFFGLIFWGIIQTPSISPALLSSIFFMLILSKLIQSFQSNTLAYQFFDAGLLLAASALLYFHSLYYLVVVYIAFTLFRPFNWRELLFPIAGIIVIYLGVISVGYLINSDDIFLAVKATSSYSNNFAILELSRFSIFFLSILFINIVISSVYISRVLMGKKILPRRIFILFLWIFVITLFSYFALNIDRNHLIFAAIPAAYLLSNYFSNCKKSVFNEALFDILFISAIIQYVVL